MNKLLSILLLFALPLVAQEERIISLSPALTELVFKLGKGRQLIARSEPCDYPPEVKKLPVAGRFADPDMERILTLRPTLVITNDLINPGVRTVMENAKIRCIQKQCSTIEEYVEWVKLLGDALKCPEEAKAECERVEREAKPLPKMKRKVLWVIWDSPLMVAGAGSLADGLLQRVGVENIAGNVKIAYFKSSYDWLLEHQPDAIVWTASKRDNLKKHRFWGNLKAVQQDRVVIVMRLRDIVAILLNIALLVLGICWGARWYSPMAFIHDFESLRPLFMLRFQRMITAITIGGSLSLAGLILQAVLRNPLAEPFTLGLSGGASIGAALSFVLGFYSKWVFAVPLGAFLGAISTLAIVLWISRCGRNGTESLLLSGVIAGTIASNVLVQILSFAQNEELAGITWWTLGDLQGTDPRLLWPGVVLLFIALVLYRCMADKIDAIALGDAQAFYLGGNPRKLTVVLVASASFLAAETVAMAGIISFCGLIIPHIVRQCFGCIHRHIVLTTALWGGAFLMICDILSRCISTQHEIPIGVMTAVIGGPLFLWLLNKQHHA